MRRLTITIRTADRHPGQNYLGMTVRSLIASGVPAADLHVVPTDPDVRWLAVELGDCPVTIHAPATRRTPNANGLAQVAVLDVAPADWLLMLEDDVEVCADVPGSVLRWLDRYAGPEVHVFRFCAFGGGRRAAGVAASTYPLREQRGSQAIALRADDARDLAAWALARGDRWRPKGAPFQDAPTKGFDKLVGYWALDRWPAQRVGLVSEPHFVRHIGQQSGLYRQNGPEHASVRWADLAVPRGGGVNGQTRSDRCADSPSGDHANLGGSYSADRRDRAGV